MVPLAYGAYVAYDAYDAYDAMVTDRVYGRAQSHEATLADCAGTQFEPELVEHFCRLVAERDEATERRGEHVLDV